MNLVIIPITDAETLGTFYFTTTLGDVDFKIHFHFNDRDQYWYFDLYDVQQNLLRAGVRCVINYPLLRLLSSVSRPVGELILLDARATTVSVPTDPGASELGVEVELGYAEV